MRCLGTGLRRPLFFLENSFSEPDTSSLNHFVGAGQHSGRHSKVKCLGGFKIENRFVFIWRLHGKVGGLFSLEDSINVTGCLPILVDLIDTVRDQAAGSNKKTLKVDRGQLVFTREGNNKVAMMKRPSARSYNQTAV